jgi:hypothetical protein
MGDISGSATSTGSFGALQISSLSGTLTASISSLTSRGLEISRVTTDTDAAETVAHIRLRTTEDMANDFGPRLSFGIEDDDFGGDSAWIAGTMFGDSVHNSALRFYTKEGAVFSEVMRLDNLKRFSMGSGLQFKEVARGQPSWATGTPTNVYSVGSSEDGMWLALLTGAAGQFAMAQWFISTGSGVNHSVTEIKAISAAAAWSGDEIHLEHSHGSTTTVDYVVYSLEERR